MNTYTKEIQFDAEGFFGTVTVQIDYGIQILYTDKGEWHQPYAFIMEATPDPDTEENRKWIDDNWQIIEKHAL